ncbi:lysophospholipid acyltransferase family protein [Marinivivus vitaminiproducens]|uniref:lysophospholipid acyltransferase family protein n=1 Tax=Marinivivus vitaminiproducens TaxID=3035935 RepID=UPI00279E727D|nr:lysophospholipid acyltransferase family protein [Geminicoccaceae bacterium SCSIO 64248]
MRASSDPVTRSAGPLIHARALLFNVWFWLWTGVMALVILPSIALPWRWMWGLVLFWLGGIRAGLRLIVGLDVEIRGLERVPGRPVVFAVKHQSAWETLVLPLIQPDVSIVLKRELADLPFFGWYTRKTGMIAVQRSAGAQALRALVQSARAVIAGGRSIIIFPEGTRAPVGRHGNHHPGIAALYRQLDAPIVPVALNSGLYWGRRSFLKRPGTVLIEFLDPLPPGLERVEFMRRLKAELDGATDRLVAEGEGRLQEAPLSEATS